MSDFFERLAEGALGLRPPGSTVQPRLAARFEPAGVGQLAGDEPPMLLEEAAEREGAAESRRRPGRPLLAGLPDLSPESGHASGRAPSDAAGRLPQDAAPAPISAERPGLGRTVAHAPTQGDRTDAHNQPDAALAAPGPRWPADEMDNLPSFEPLAERPAPFMPLVSITRRAPAADGHPPLLDQSDLAEPDHPDRAGPGQPADAQPTIRVTIGRVEIRAVVQPPVARPTRPAPRPSLDEYLRSRRGSSGE
jgi:hypothetical protein